MKIAVFDIGTNSIHMLVVDAHKNGSFKVLDHEKDTARLGDGSFESKKLSKVSMERAFAVIGRFHKLAEKRGVQCVIGVATSAVRDAKNGRHFVRRLFRETGVEVRIITGKEEARLIFLAAISEAPKNEKAVVLDIGGGSVEFILGSRRKIYFLESFPLGVARLTDHFISTDPPSKKELAVLERFLERRLKNTTEKARKIGFASVIGTAGTLINLASMAYEAREEKPLKIKSHSLLKIKNLNEIHETLLRSKIRERLILPGLDARRADLIIAGSIFLKTIMRLLGVGEILISKKGIRQGLILDFIAKHKKII